MSEPIDPDVVGSIERFVRDWMTEADVPGASVAITDEQETVYAEGFGSRDLATNAPATPRTRYGIGSITKSFTALAVLQCVERGELALEDAIVEHTPVAFDGAEEITLHELLSHRSGLPSLGTSEVLIARQGGAGEHGIPLGDMDDVYAFVDGAGDERDDHSRGRFMYSNEGYVLLADAVERTVGRPFAEYVRESILDPLGLETAGFVAANGTPPDAASDDVDAPTMTPYRQTDDGPTEASLPVRELSQGPGGLFATVDDLAGYLRFQLTGDPSVLDRSLQERAHGEHTETPSGPYGYGWRTRSIAGGDLVGHGGSIMVATAFAGFLPEERLGVALLCNTGADPHPTQCAEGIVAHLRGRDPDETVPYYRYQSQVDPLEGEYEAYGGVRTATVEDRGGVLELTVSNGIDDRTLLLRPEDDRYREFTVQNRGGYEQPVTFVETDDGIDLFVDRIRFHHR